MKKKFMLLVAIMVLVVCGGAFARPPMYAGLELGYGSIDPSVTVGDLNYLHADAFELVPVFGIAPFSGLPGLALEFNLMMDFSQATAKYDRESTVGEGEQPRTEIKTHSLKMLNNIITPQILAVYTFGEGPVRPFAGAGIGVNINNGKVEGTHPDDVGNNGELTANQSTAVDKFDLGASFSLVAKAGFVANIPNTKFDLIFLTRYNLNIIEKVSMRTTTTQTQGNTTTSTLKDETIYGPFNFSNLSFALGARFNF